jgi:hypothetical protein
MFLAILRKLQTEQVCQLILINNNNAYPLYTYIQTLIFVLIDSKEKKMSKASALLQQFKKLSTIQFKVGSGIQNLEFILFCNLKYLRSLECG